MAAFSSDVDLYVLDEPTSGLDPLMEAVFQDCVEEVAHAGKTVLLSSHILAEVEALVRSREHHPRRADGGKREHSPNSGISRARPSRRRRSVSVDRWTRRTRRCPRRGDRR